MYVIYRHVYLHAQRVAVKLGRYIYYIHAYGLINDGPFAREIVGHWSNLSLVSRRVYGIRLHFDVYVWTNADSNSQPFVKSSLWTKT